MATLNQDSLTEVLVVPALGAVSVNLYCYSGGVSSLVVQGRTDSSSNWESVASDASDFRNLSPPIFYCSAVNPYSMQANEVSKIRINGSPYAELRILAAGTGTLIGSGSSSVQADTTNTSVVGKANQPADEYIAMIPGSQAILMGSAKSVAGLPTAEAYPSSLVGRGSLTEAQMWANPGYMSSTAAVGGQFEVSLSAYAPNLRQGQGQLLFFRVNTAVPLANTALVAQGTGTTNIQGYSLQAMTSASGFGGRLSVSHVSVIGGSPAAQALGYTNSIVCDSTDHTVGLVIHPSGFVAVWVDGRLDNVFSVNPSVPLGVTTPTAPLTFGATPTVGTNGNTALAAKFSGLHLMSFKVIPLNLNQIMSKLHADPMSALRNSDIVRASRSVFIYWAAAQSNESGSGNTPGIVGPYGFPDRDPLGASRSVKNGIAARLATRGIATLWGNSAQGGTSAADSWAGRIRTWVSGNRVVTGSYQLYNGNVYKCANAIGYGGASTTPPAVGTGADGVSWTLARAVTTEDTTVLAGTGVYPLTSLMSDPNGLMFGGVSRAGMAASSVDSIIAIISIGQGDRSCGVTRAVYADALIKIIDYHINKFNTASKVFVGMTVRSNIGTGDLSSSNGGGAANAANTSADLWYDTHLLPGREDALAFYAKDLRVVRGHDWANGIGPVSVQAYPNGIGVKADMLHMTDRTYEELAVPILDAALLAGGI